MIDFDEWFEGEMPNSHKKVNKERIETVIYSCAEASWNHQQAKIDELQARVDATEKWIESNKKNIPLSEWHGYTTEEYVDADDLLEILKGSKDEN